MDTSKFDPLAEEINELSAKLKAKIEKFIEAANGEVFYDPQQVSLPLPRIGREDNTEQYRFHLTSLPLQGNRFISAFQSRRVETNWEKELRLKASAEKVTNERVESAKTIERDRINGKLSYLRSNLEAVRETYRQYASWPTPMNLSQIQGTIKEYEDEIEVLEEELAAVC